MPPEDKRLLESPCEQLTTIKGRRSPCLFRRGKRPRRRGGRGGASAALARVHLSLWGLPAWKKRVAGAESSQDDDTETQAGATSTHVASLPNMPELWHVKTSSKLPTWFNMPFLAEFSGL